MNVLSIVPFHVPSTLINVDIPLKKLHESGHIHYESQLEYTVTPEQVAAADVIVLCRNTEPKYHRIYELAQRLGIPMIYVLDDDITAAPPGSQSYTYHHHPRRLAEYAWFLRHASLIRVHSPALAETVGAYDTPCSLVWAPVDWSLTPDAPPPLGTPLKIVYAAQRESGQQLFELMRTDLIRLVETYPDALELHFLGYIPDGFADYPNVVRVPLERDYTRFFTAFTRAGYAIGLAPMLDTQFFRSKTDMKYRDYAAAGAVGIYMDSRLYTGSVIDGETGVIISGAPGSWFAAVEDLMRYPAKLEAMRQQAYAAVRAKYHMDTVGPMWLDDFARLPARPPMDATRRDVLDKTRWRFTAPQDIWHRRARRWLKRVVSRFAR